MKNMSGLENRFAIMYSQRGWKGAKLLFNRRTFGPPMRKARMRFLWSLAQKAAYAARSAAQQRFVEKDPMDPFQLRQLYEVGFHWMNSINTNIYST